MLLTSKGMANEAKFPYINIYWPLENEKCLEMQSTHPLTQLECPRHSGGAERGIRRNQVPLSSKHVESREVTSSSVTGLCNL